ncbi:MAG: YdcF family protein [Rhizobiaceae bacterium]
MLHKLLPALVSPLAITLFLMVIALLSRRLWPIGLAMVVLLVGSNPMLAQMGQQYLEKGQVLRPVDTVEPADAIVVLSGMVETISEMEGKLSYEFNGAVDRYEAGIRLMKAGKAQKLIFTRGFLLWSKGRPEGEILAEFAIDRGIDQDKILLTRKVENTSDEAKAVAELLSSGQRTILVTSAFHMPRAQPLFAQQDLRIDPFPVDFKSQAVEFNLMHLVPQAGALSGNTRVMRELLGRLYYHIKSSFA